MIIFRLKNVDCKCVDYDLYEPGTIKQISNNVKQKISVIVNQKTNKVLCGKISAKLTKLMKDTDMKIAYYTDINIFNKMKRKAKV